MDGPHTHFVEQLNQYRAHFPGPHLGMVIDSMLAGNTAGELWNVGDDTAPLLVLWDGGNGVFYLAGAGEDPPIDALTDLLRERILPHPPARGTRRFKLRALSPALQRQIPHLLPNISLRETITQFSVHDAGASVPRPGLDLPHVTLLPITPALLSGDDMEGMGAVRAEIRGMWISEERFYEEGFGTAALMGNQLICWCTAEYVGPTRCGIGIETAPEYQRRGVATAAVAHFLQEAGARGLTACWECDRDNAASVRVAEKTGFAVQAEEPYWIGFISPYVGSAP